MLQHFISSLSCVLLKFQLQRCSSEDHIRDLATYFKTRSQWHLDENQLFQIKMFLSEIRRKVDRSSQFLKLQQKWFLVNSQVLIFKGGCGRLISSQRHGYVSRCEYLNQCFHTLESISLVLWVMHSLSTASGSNNTM